jgi:hypothetical protein
MLKRFWFVILFIFLFGVLVYFLFFKEPGVVGEKQVVKVGAYGVGNVSFAKVTGGVVVLEMDKVPLLWTWPLLIFVIILLEIIVWKVSRRKNV